MDHHRISSGFHERSQQALGRRGLLKGGAALAGLPLLGQRAARAATPQYGGNLRVAITGGAATDTLDAHKTNAPPDLCRIMTLYEGLTTLDANGKVINVLAESFEASADAKTWTIRLRKGVEFHNGKSLKAEDIVYTFNRIGNPKNPLQGQPGLAPIDLPNLKILDDLTLRVPMNTPYATFPEAISPSYYFGVIPVGYDPTKPIGTGAFKYQSFNPGQQSVFTRFDNYWKHKPYLDSVTVIDGFQSDTAAYNALIGGEVDVYAYATFVLAKEAQGGSGIKSLVSNPGLWIPFNMNITQAPFNDPNVRKAMRLLVDRQQMVDLALDGYGAVGNDVFSPWDPASDLSLVRHRDVDQAKFLLKKSGHDNLALELTTVNLAPGALQMAQVFAQQAKDANVNVSLKQTTVDTFYADYGKWAFCQDYWVYMPYLPLAELATLPTSPYNATHWNDPTYNKLYAEAQGTINTQKRYELVHEMQKIDFDDGGLIIPCFNKGIDLMQSYVNGFEPTNTGCALGNFDFANAWMSS